MKTEPVNPGNFLIMALLALQVLAFPAHTYAGDSVSPRVDVDHIVAIVNNNVITQTELDDQTSTVKIQLRQQNMQVPPKSTLQKQVLERMISEQIQLQLAEAGGIQVDDEMLNQTVSGIATQNNMTLSQFRDALQDDGYDFGVFRENIRKEIILRRLRQQSVDSRIIITDQEIDNFLVTQRRQGSSADEYHIAHIMIALPEAATPDQIQRSMEKTQEILNQLKQNADFSQIAISSSDGQQALNGGDLGWRKGAELPTLFAELVPRMKVGEISDIIRSSSGLHIIKLIDRRTAAQHIVTQTHVRHILIRPSALTTDQQAQETLLDIKRRVIAGEDFSAIAKTISEDKASATLGGDLGWVEPGTMIPDFEQTMDKLARDEISEPVKTRFGWHLIQVLDRREYDNTEEFTREQARSAISQRKIEEEGTEWLRRLRDEAYVEYR